MSQKNEQLRKLFVGGLRREAIESALRETFSNYGNIIDVAVMRDNQQCSRGFGFVTFDDASCVDQVMKDKKDGVSFTICNGNVEVKRALPKTEQGFQRDRGSLLRPASNKRIFVGGLASLTKSEDLKAYFQSFGKVLEAIVMMDKSTNKSRGFGFVSFEDEDVADKVCALRDHEINGKMCEVRKAESKVPYNNRKEREMPIHGNRYLSEPPMQQRPPPPVNTPLDPNNLSSAVQLLSSLQTLLNAAQLQQSFSAPNPLAPMPNAPPQSQVGQIQSQANLLQVLQNTLSSQSLQSAPHAGLSASSQPQQQPSNQLGMLLNALGNNPNVSGAGLGGNALTGLLTSLAGQNADPIKIEQHSPPAGFLTPRSASVPGTDVGNSQNTGYYEDGYSTQQQTSSSFGPVRHTASHRLDGKQNAYRPY